MSKLPDWMPDDEEIAGVIRGECWDAGGGDSRRAARAIRELLERKAGDADDELWRAMRIVARATPSLYIPAELLELCRTPDEFIRHASRVAGLNGRQPDGKPDPAPVASEPECCFCDVMGARCAAHGRRP